jgi:hypothetical protein
MTQHIRLWRVTSMDRLEEVSPGALDLESRLETWMEADVSVVEADLLVIGRQVATDFGGIIDLLCLDPNGDVVILELKRAKTPREITAQALDYASWVADLPPERILEMANAYLRANGPLESAFKQKFGVELPETVNAAHRMLIVASEIDASSERIIHYLSNRHGVNINAVTFQCFRAPEGGEWLVRVFLLEPEDVEYKAHLKGSTPRRSRLSAEQLQELADERGVGELFAQALALFRPHFEQTRTTRSSIGLVARFHNSHAAMLNLIPLDSSAERGLAFQVYSMRLGERFGLSASALRAALPQGATDWKYYAAATEEWGGYQGYFQTVTDVERLIASWATPEARPV